MVTRERNSEVDIRSHQPSVLYKYRNWEDDYHRRILTHNELYFASPDQFNDPFDSKIHVREFSPSKIVDESQIFTNHNIRICSLSAKHDSVLMWSHYAKNHEGFCVGLRAKKIHAQFDEWNKANCKVLPAETLGGVPRYSHFLTTHFAKYGDHPTVTQLHLLTHMRSNRSKEPYFPLYTFKANDWSYEEEVRAIYYRKGLEVGEPVTLGFDDDCIAYVLLGWKMSDEHKEQVTAIVREKNKILSRRESPTRDLVELRQAERDSNTFNLKFLPVDG